IRYLQSLKILRGHSNVVRSIRLSPDATMAVSSSDDHTICIWDIESGHCIHSFGHYGIGIFGGQFSPDGKMIALCIRDRIQLCDLDTLEIIREFRGHLEAISGIRFSPNGKQIVSISCDNTIRLWDVESEMSVKQLWEYHGEPYDIQFSPNGQTLASVFDGTIIIWDVESKKKINEWKGHWNAVQKIHFSPDGQSIVSCSKDNIIRIWDVTLGKEVKQIKGHLNFVSDVKYLCDGQTIVSSSWDKTIRIWNIESGREIQRLIGHSEGVTAIDISADGNTIKLFFNALQSINKNENYKTNKNTYQLLYQTAFDTFLKFKQKSAFNLQKFKKSRSGIKKEGHTIFLHAVFYRVQVIDKLFSLQHTVFHRLMHVVLAKFCKGIDKKLGYLIHFDVQILHFRLIEKFLCDNKIKNII
ncbi:WD-40 repeat-containing protein, partial [Reticulomyxa filosa]